jgi:uncharacterized protein YceK
MRFQSLISVALAICVCALSGCGTMANLTSSNPTVYGGVSQDLIWESSVSQCHENKLFGLIVYLGILPVEFGSTAILDTATLPIVLLRDHQSKVDWTSSSADSLGKKTSQSMSAADAPPPSPLPEAFYATDRP